MKKALLFILSLMFLSNAFAAMPADEDIAAEITRGKLMTSQMYVRSSVAHLDIKLMDVVEAMNIKEQNAGEPYSHEEGAIRAAILNSFELERVAVMAEIEEFGMEPSVELEATILERLRLMESLMKDF